MTCYQRFHFSEKQFFLKHFLLTATIEIPQSISFWKIMIVKFSSTITLRVHTENRTKLESCEEVESLRARRTMTTFSTTAPFYLKSWSLLKSINILWYTITYKQTNYLMFRRYAYVMVFHEIIIILLLKRSSVNGCCNTPAI